MTSAGNAGRRRAERAAAQRPPDGVAVAPPGRPRWWRASPPRRLHELAPGNDPISHLTDRVNPRWATRGLSAGQRRALANGFIAEPSTGRTLVMTLEALRGESNGELDRAFIAAFEAMLRGDDDVLAAVDAFPLLAGRFGGNADRWLRRGERRSWEMTMDDVRTAWGRARVDLALPLVNPMPLRPPAVRGVGGDTP